VDFREWKTLTMARLVEYAQRYPDKRVAIESIAAKLQYLKARDLAQFIFTLFMLSKDIPESKELIPSVDDVEKWLKSQEED
jgi:hypothetical protein